MADLPPLLKSKFQYVYDVFYDINHDGMISWDDFVLYLSRISKTNNWPEGSEKYVHAQETLQMIWDGLRKFADENMDDEVSKEEWFHMWKEVVEAHKNKTDFPPWLKQYMDFMFNVADTSGDSVVDLEEFQKAYVDYGVTNDSSQQAFQKVSQNGTVELNRDSYSKLWTEYFLSEDKNAPGNYLFGMQNF